MKKYQFKLDTLLKIKEQLEDQLKYEFSSVMNRLKKEQAILERYIHNKELLIAEFASKQNKAMKAVEVILYFEAINDMTEMIAAKRQDIAQIQLELNALIKKLVAASKDKKILQKLEEKEFLAYKQSLASEEQRLNDEFNSYKYYKNGQNENI